MKRIFSRRITITVAIIFLTLGVKCQEKLANLDALTFSVPDDNDTVYFIKINKDVKTPKPTIVFCQGSLPIPLVIESADNSFFLPAINFDYSRLANRYNLIVISMPHIPVIAKQANLNNQFAFITNPADQHSFPKTYLEDDYLTKYVDRGNEVVNFLINQKWVEKDSIIVIGHSQGARVATKIAKTNKHIAALGLFSGDPLGRVTQNIRRIRLMQRQGQLTPSDAQAKINEIYIKWKQLNTDPELAKTSSITSFSEPLISDLLEIKIPIYVAYGTEDVAAEYCDLLPIDFIQNHKNNFKVVPYSGLEHNFMELDSLGNPDPSKFHWDEVFQEFINWLEEPDTLIR
ncbi:alpha/beta fold hydrolase [Mangrovibacterium diazotrophicum]|uniref:Uncharacterized protein n=1 Tax=Mangrovibacterium diazotrophicum TaxID=1261403 RepID=A0A419WAI0_9BACT|nr:hypothetical protein [Mangrovibacterium diazotrophicum]RKD92491.1 hypothetical protein BC643_2864 [Mangrovibacterium diazotrophicum]